MEEPLDQKKCYILADALGDTPETVISVHVLRRGLSKAYVSGDPSCFDAAIIQADAFPTEPTAFGSDPHVIWELLRGVEGWDCILVESPCAPVLGEIIEREMGISVRYFDDVCCILTRPVSTYCDAAARQLTLDDLELLECAAPELRASCWESTRALLTEGIIACAIVPGQACGERAECAPGGTSARTIVATALVAARSEHHAEIGVYTHEDFRCRGFATAAASIVAARAQEAGLIPVWSAGEHNAASLRVAEKLGFVEVSRRTYVILDRSKLDDQHTP